MPDLITTLSMTFGISYKSTVEGSTGTFAPQFSHSDTMNDGVVLDTNDQVWWDIGRTLAATTNDDLDLTANNLTDPFGGAQTWAKVKGIYIQNNNTVAGDTLEIGGQGTADFLLFNAIGDKYILGPGGLFCIWEPSLAGLPVTATTADIFRIRNPGSNTVTFDICIVGTTS